MYKKLTAYLQESYKKIEEKQGKLELGDKLIIKITLKEAIKKYFPQFKEETKIPLTDYIIDLHNNLLKSYGLNYLDKSKYLLNKTSNNSKNLKHYS